jgi:tetratricopeptide (TPR) repeat protein
MNAPHRQSAASAEHPFPGLRPFAYRDHEFFFGREKQTYALYRLVYRSHFVAVVGSSGSGKSSLVRAGLLPLLDSETRESGGRNWLWCEMHPGDAPLQRLTDLLANLSDDDDPVVASGRRERIAALLQGSSFGIAEALAETDGLDGKSLILIVDQFEELFRYATAAEGTSSLSGNQIRARDEATQFVQLLLEASKASSIPIHVVLTMRSDFIGDCARFHGLPEAVSAVQFLVPSLTRDRLDDVIRAPVEKAGAVIDPELVERLLNDCSTEMDQLPVLQHCLSRLWEEAGKSAAAATSLKRSLTLDHYRGIGEFAGALSQHADEILRNLSGPKLQLAVEQVFRALSELDGEGRAIRRALRFSQLVAETGVEEQAARQVVERFRADDCSFLTPPPSDVKEIHDGTRIDVGHESLLRRWTRMSGHGADPGWLRTEQLAGERYRGMLAMADGASASLPSHLIAERLAWWKARPWTEAWAERYGGGFERVQRLLEVSRRQRLKKPVIIAALVLPVAVAAVTSMLWRSARVAQIEADASRRTALQATKTSIGRLGGFLNDGTVSASGAQRLLEDARLTLEDLAKNENQSVEISVTQAELLLGFADVRDALGDRFESLRYAEQVVVLSERLLKRDPDSATLKRLLYSGRFRIGDAKQLAGDIQGAESQYNAALDIARQLASRDPENVVRLRDITFVLNKLADVYAQRRDWKGAMDNYLAGLKIAETVATKYPIDVATQKARIAGLLSNRGEPGDLQAALTHYREALSIQMRLLSQAPNDANLLSNAAVTHRRIGRLLKEQPAEARLEYAAAVASRRKLFDFDPDNVNWQTGLATDYLLLGDTLMELKDFTGATQTYTAATPILERLVQKYPTNAAWRRNLATANLRRGDALIRLGNEASINPRLIIDESARLVNDALVRYRAAATGFQQLADNPAGGSSRHRSLFDVQIRIGDILVRQSKYKEAIDAYRAAATTAMNTGSIGVADWQIKVSKALEEAGDLLANLETSDAPAGDEPSSSAFYKDALQVVEAAAEKEPDNHDLQSRKTAIIAKIDAQRPAAR